MSERDTHFLGFAKALQDELNEAWKQYVNDMEAMSDEEYAQRIRLIVARRAYDLVEHVYNLAPVSEYTWSMEDIPDVTTLPEVNEIVSRK